MSKEIKHVEREHALLAASSASRWLTCTPSAVLADKYGEDKTSSFAEEGTLAHEFCELSIRRDIRSDSDVDYEAETTRLKSSKYYKDEMLAYVHKYVTYCNQQFTELREKDPSADIQVEQRLDITKYIPDGFGTADCVIMGDDVLEVIDLKYGKGVPVYAPYNKQLMIYALGAYEKFSFMYDFKVVRMTIVQPRLDNISTFEMSVTDLLEWAKMTLKPTALIAYNGLGELVTGDHCKFCPVKARCRALYNASMSILKSELDSPHMLSEKEIVGVYSQSKRLKEYLEAIEKYLVAQSIAGKKYEGFKLVRASSKRAWISEEAVDEAVKASDVHIDQEILYDMKLATLSSVEKALGKELFAKVFASAVEVKEGNLTVVPDSDKRKAVDPAQQAKIDFKSDENDLD